MNLETITYFPPMTSIFIRPSPILAVGAVKVVTWGVWDSCGVSDSDGIDVCFLLLFADGKILLILTYNNN